MKINTFVVFIMLICVQVGIAQETGFNPLKDVKGFTIKFNENVKNLNTIKSDFVQEKHLSFMDDNIVSKGIFRYKKEKKLRLEYTTPFKYLMVLNNDKIYIKEGSNKTNKFDTRSNKLFKQINDMLMNTMNGSVLNGKDYFITYYENGDEYLLELIPQDKSVLELIQKLRIYIDKKKMNVCKVRIIEKSGDYTLMRFLNVQQNIEVKDEEFVVR
jgi:outer membrane lipoprotein-sorting protein